MGTTSMIVPGDEPRAILNVRDARVVLESSRASFTELLECASVFKQASDWSGQKEAASRAIDEVLRLPMTRDRGKRLVDAARHVAFSTLSSGSTLAGFVAPLEEANTALEQIIHRTTLTSVQQSRFSEVIGRVEQIRMDVSETLLILADGCPSESAARLSSCLRRLERSDLAVIGVENGSIPRAPGTALQVSYSSALIDVGRANDAFVAIQVADRESPNDEVVLVVYSRAAQAIGQARNALTLAERAFSIGMDKFTARRLIAAISVSIASGDELAREFLMRHGPSLSEYLGEAELDEVAPLTRIVAIEVLIKEKLFTEARIALEGLLSSREPIPEKLDLRLSRIRQQIDRVSVKP